MTGKRKEKKKRKSFTFVTPRLDAWGGLCAVLDSGHCQLHTRPLNTNLGQRRCEPNEGFDVIPRELLKVSSNCAHVINEDTNLLIFCDTIHLPVHTGDTKDGGKHHFPLAPCQSQPH